MSWFKVTIGATVLCDDAASPPNRGVREKFGGQSLVQSEDLYGSAVKFLAGLGNAAGEFVFTCQTSYASAAAAAAAAAANYDLLNTQGTVVWIYGTGTGSTLTMANALLYQSEAVKWDGKALTWRFGIKFTTVVSS